MFKDTTDRDARTVTNYHELQDTLVIEISDQLNSHAWIQSTASVNVKR